MIVHNSRKTSGKINTIVYENYIRSKVLLEIIQFGNCYDSYMAISCGEQHYES